jgi:flagellar biosynthesis/type III secretory pathway chaperone
MDHRMNKITKSEKLAVYYFQVTDLWKRLCEEHSLLFDVTCDEYSLLLSSELDSLEDKIKEKEEIVRTISKLELTRKELINDLVTEFPETKIESVSALLEFMRNYEIEKNEKHLFRFNALLIDIIEKIQAQNKRNQLFINKALYSLKQIRMEALGQKNYSTYSAKGSAISSSTPRG